MNQIPPSPDNIEPEDLPALDRSEVEAAYNKHSVELERFLLGILKEPMAAADALQSTFTQLIRKGHTVEPDSLKSWLFRVAYNQAMLIFRKRSTRKQVVEKAAWTLKVGHESRSLVDSVASAIRDEDVRLVQQAIAKLSVEYQQVVTLRIYENLKFKQISQKLDVPLGTVLTRMQSALRKLRDILGDH